MPKPNGVDTASTLRRKLPQVKIVGFSALANDPDFREKLFASKDFDAVLSKFDGLDTLAEAVRALLLQRVARSSSSSLDQLFPRLTTSSLIDLRVYCKKMEPLGPASA
jgi:DNA-binding NarL/FixJ family response regulator